MYTKEEDGDEIPMMKYDEFLEVLKIRSLEKVVYTRNLKPFQIHQKQIPPLISPTIAGDITFNTEHDKKSVYLKDGKSSEGNYNSKLYYGLSVGSHLYFGSPSAMKFDWQLENKPLPL